MNTTNLFNTWLTSLFFSLFITFPISTPLSSIIMLLIILTWIISFKKENTFNTVKNNKYIWILFGFYLFLILQSIRSPANLNWISVDLGKYAKILYACILISFFTKYPTLKAHALNGFIGGMLLILTATLINTQINIPWSWSFKNGTQNNYSVFTDYIIQNIMMAFFFVISSHRAWVAKTIKNKAFWGSISILAAISIIYLSIGRTGFIVLLSSILTISIANTQKKYQVAIITILGALIVGIYYSSDTLQSRFIKGIEEIKNHDVDPTTSMGRRIYQYKLALPLLEEKPFLGQGTGGFHARICDTIDHNLSCESYRIHPDNQILLFGVDHGIIGVAFYLFIIYNLYLIGIQQIDKEKRNLLLAFTSIFFIDSIFSSALYSSFHSHFFLYMGSLLVSDSAS